MERTAISLPSDLHYRLKAMAAGQGRSMSALIREALEDPFKEAEAIRIGEERAIYVTERERPEEVVAMKRIVISLPSELHREARAFAAAAGLSMAAYIRGLLIHRVNRERPKPRFGAFDSGYADTARLAGEMQFEPRSWR